MTKEIIGGPVQRVVIVDPVNIDDQGGMLQIVNRQLQLDSISIGNQPTVTIGNVSIPVTLSGQPIEIITEVPTIFKSISNVAITSEATLWTPTSGKKFRLLGGYLSYITAVALVNLIDGSGGTTFFTLPQVVLATPFRFDIPGGYTSVAANNLLRAAGGSLQVLTGTIWGDEV